MYTQILRELIAAGLSGDALASAFERIEATDSTRIPPENRVDKAAEKRREWDRNYRRRRVDSTRIPPDSTRIPLSPLISKKERKRPLTEIPPDWKPPDRAVKLAFQLKVNVSDVEPRFRDYLASSGKRYADYDAAFCNFIRNTPRFQKSSSNSRPLTPSGNPWPEGIT